MSTNHANVEPFALFQPEYLFVLLYRSRFGSVLATPRAFHCRSKSVEDAEVKLREHVAGAVPLWSASQKEGERNSDAYRRAMSEYRERGMDAQGRAQYWKQRAKCAEGMLVADITLAAQRVHGLSVLHEVPWDHLSTEQRAGFERVACEVVRSIDDARRARAPHDAEPAAGLQLAEHPGQLKAERDALAQAIGGAAVTCGLYDTDVTSMTQPQLITACWDMANAIVSNVNTPASAHLDAVVDALQAVLEGDLVLTRQEDALELRRVLDEYAASKPAGPSAAALERARAKLKKIMQAHAFNITSMVPSSVHELAAEAEALLNGATVITADQQIGLAVLAWLDDLPDAVRVREGGGLEDVAASFAVNASKLSQAATEAREDVETLRGCLHVAVGDNPVDYEDGDGINIATFLVPAVAGDTMLARRKLASYRDTVAAAEAEAAAEAAADEALRRDCTPAKEASP